MWKGLLVFFALVSTQVLVVAADYRSFTSQDGSTIEARVIAASEDKVSIERHDGRVYKDVPLTRFSVEDRRYIRQWHAEQQKLVDDAEITHDAKLRPVFLKGKDDDFNSYGDIDDRIINFEPEVVIDNQDYVKTYTRIKGTLVVVGKGVINKKEYTILNKQDFTILAVPPRQKARWTGEGFQCRYDPDYGGFEYGGYLIVLRDRSGRIVMSKGSKSSWEKAPEHLLKAEKYKGYDGSFSKSHQLYTTFGIPR